MQNHLPPELLSVFDRITEAFARESIHPYTAHCTTGDGCAVVCMHAYDVINIYQLDGDNILLELDSDGRITLSLHTLDGWKLHEYDDITAFESSFPSIVKNRS
jgi:hypothetical protein